MVVALAEHRAGVGVALVRPELAVDIPDPAELTGPSFTGALIHVEPGRDTEHLYQILTGEKLALLKRGTAEKAASVTPARSVASTEKPAEKTGEKPTEKPADKPGEKKDVAPATSPPAIPHSPIEDWWLVRDSHARVGWVLARMVDLDVPLDVAQYAEGQRIVAFFVLNQVQDGDKKVSQYLTVLTEPKDGLPFDFNQFRVFTWNVKRHRYETAYRERIEGVLPVTVAQQDFGKEGGARPAESRLTRVVGWKIGRRSLAGNVCVPGWIKRDAVAVIVVRATEIDRI